MTKEKTFPVGIRLTQRHLDALAVYREQKEQEAREVLPGYDLTASHALRLLVEGELDRLGLVAPVATSKRQKKPKRATATGAKGTKGSTDTNGVYAAIEADLISGKFNTQREIADKHGVDPAIVTRRKNALKEAGKL